MIVSRAPTRITLGGGGTDLASYYSKYGGFLIAGGINKYCTILATRRFYDTIRLSYSAAEMVNRPAEIKHPIFRASLELMHIESGIELHSSADVPAGSGLGSSSSFTVALLNALHAYTRDYVNQKQLAEEACKVEIDILGEPIGKQDQYMAAFGGLTCLSFEKDGEVVVEPLRIADDMLDQLENNLLLFFTGKERSASEILSDQNIRSQAQDPNMIQNLHKTKEIGLLTRRYLEAGNLDTLGELFNEHWENKKKRSAGMTDPRIDEYYETAMHNGALGGKLIGAGGGGFLMFYCRNGSKPKLIRSMQKAGLRWERFRFDHDGAKLLVNTFTRN
ncbi:MAG: GHMP kinase [Dehalococcoidales bacterium]|nr:GHMP kinase [Dehalococcoidales bacterium]